MGVRETSLPIWRIAFGCLFHQHSTALCDLYTLLFLGTLPPFALRNRPLRTLPLFPGPLRQRPLPHPEDITDVSPKRLAIGIADCPVSGAGGFWGPGDPWWLETHGSYRRVRPASASLRPPT